MEKEGKDKPEIFDITQLDTYNLLILFINVLAEKAWQHLGLRTVSGSDKIEEDFERARVAIDCIAFLTDKLETHIPEEIQKRLKSTLTDLQINFVRLREKK